VLYRGWDETAQDLYQGSVELFNCFDGTEKFGRGVDFYVDAGPRNQTLDEDLQVAYIYVYILLYYYYIIIYINIIYYILYIYIIAVGGGGAVDAGPRNQALEADLQVFFFWKTDVTGTTFGRAGTNLGRDGLSLGGGSTSTRTRGRATRPWMKTSRFSL